MGVTKVYQYRKGKPHIAIQHSFSVLERLADRFLFESSSLYR